MNSIRKLHFQYNNNALTVSDNDTGFLVYVGGMQAGGSKSACELSRAGKQYGRGFPVGTITWSPTSGHFTLQMASGRHIEMHRSNILSRA